MKCPVDDHALVMSERQGIEIDYCPSCRGVWLDRGELDKIIERSAGDEPRRNDRGDRDDDRRRYDDDRSRFGRKKKKESFLSELFEFGG
ncbi:MAG: zf-TFIIB domain-containing protein [Actinomycetota bacterium]